MPYELRTIELRTAMNEQVTILLEQIQAGNAMASERLLPLVYEELRRLAAARMASERAGHTIDATELVHEAYLRLVGNHRQRLWNSRGHFFGAAAEAMRQILIDDARRKRCDKHGGQAKRLPLDSIREPTELPPAELLALDEALEELAQRDSARAQVVKLRFYAGFSIPETADLLHISPATVKRHWTFARAWLFAYLQDHAAGEDR